MKIPSLLEVPKLFIFAKVEKYLIIGNNLLLEASEKTWEQVYKAANLLERFEKNYLNSKKPQITKYFDSGKKWFQTNGYSRSDRQTV
ncbi:hypothetical protein [Chlorogloeopsis sp. ULAP02]|uniref:hypothetical protein n=1 Tax=Chlorogloeopsis sp. ULAP02 TaxID=3107926 RepID=UPI003134EA92